MSETRTEWFNPEEKQVIKKYLVGGAALGGGAALITSLLNYLQHLKNQNENSSADDDVVYVYKDDEAEKTASWLGTGTGIAVGAASALATYALIKKLYSKFRAKQAQEELDKAQHVFLDAHGYKDVKDREKKKEGDVTKEDVEEVVSEMEDDIARDKAASVVGEAEQADNGRGLSKGEVAIAAPVAIPLLLALASGVVTNEVLKSKYGAPKPKIKPPKRIEVVEKPEDDQDEYSKNANYSEALIDDACDFMIHMTLANPVKNSDLLNIVKSAAMGGHRAFKDTVMTVGFPAALSMVKGASAELPHPLAEHLAICYLNKSARLKHNIRLVAAGEFAEQYPQLFKQACNLPRKTQDILLKVAGLLGIAMRAERSQELGVRAEGFNVKQAAVAKPGEEEDLLSELITRINKEREDEKSDQGVSEEEERDPATEGDEYESSDTSGEEAGIDDPDSPSRAGEGDKLNFVRTGKTTRRYVKGQDNDIIDELLSAK